MANKTRLLLAEARASVHQKQSRCLGRGGGRAAVLPFFSPPPKPSSEASQRTQCQELAPAGFVRGSTLPWQPTHKVPSMAAPPSCLFTFIPTRGIVPIVCHGSWKNESWAFCLPSAGRLCHISSSNARPPAPLPRIPAGPFVRGAGLCLPAAPCCCCCLLPGPRSPHPRLEGARLEVLQPAPSPRSCRGSSPCLELEY